MLNEFLPHPRTDWNGDGTMDTGDEYIELINMGTASVNVSNWKLDNGAGSANSFALPNLTLLPRQIAVFYHADTGIGLSDVGSSVRLLKPDGRTADIYNYPFVTAADRTWCRLPDGTGGWGFVCSPRRGNRMKRPNRVPRGWDRGDRRIGLHQEPGAGDDPGSRVQQPRREDMEEGGNGEIWLKNRLKFGVFVE